MAKERFSEQGVTRQAFFLPSPAMILAKYCGGPQPATSSAQILVQQRWTSKRGIQQNRIFPDSGNSCLFHRLLEFQRWKRPQKSFLSAFPLFKKILQSITNKFSTGSNMFVLFARICLAREIPDIVNQAKWAHNSKRSR